MHVIAFILFFLSLLELFLLPAVTLHTIRSCVLVWSNFNSSSILQSHGKTALVEYKKHHSMVKLTGWLPDWACLSLPAWAVSMAAWAKRVYKQHFGCMRTCEVQLSHCSTTSGNRGVPLELVGPLERPSMIQELAGKEFWLEANLGSWQAIPLKSRHLLNSEAKDIYRNGQNTPYCSIFIEGLYTPDTFAKI